MKNFKNLKQSLCEKKKITREIGMISRRLGYFHKYLRKLYFRAENHSIETELLKKRGEKIKEKYFIPEEKMNKVRRLAKKMKMIAIDYRNNRI